MKVTCRKLLSILAVLSILLGGLFPLPAARAEGPAGPDTGDSVEVAGLTPAGGTLNGAVPGEELGDGNSVKAVINYSLVTGKRGRIRVFTAGVAGNQEHSGVDLPVAVGPGTGTVSTRFSVLCDGKPASPVRIGLLRVALLETDEAGTVFRTLAEQFVKVDYSFVCQGQQEDLKDPFDPEEQVPGQETPKPEQPAGAPTCYAGNAREPLPGPKAVNPQLKRSNEVVVEVDGLTVAPPGEPAAFVDAASGRTLVPVRFIAEAMGARVQWDAAARRVVIVTGNVSDERRIEIPIGALQTDVSASGQDPGEESSLKVPDLAPRPGRLDTPARIVNGRTFVPLRFVGETLGLDVQWDAAERTVRLVNQFCYDIDPEIDPGLRLSYSTGPKVIAAAESPDGVREEFVEDELIVRERPGGGLARFLEKYGGTVVDRGDIPEPAPAPVAAGEVVITLDRLRFRATADPGYRLVQIDPDRADLEGFAARAWRLGLRGTHRFSSERAARLAAIAAQAQMEDGELVSAIAPNSLFKGSSAPPLGTPLPEHPRMGGGNRDARSASDFPYLVSGAPMSINVEGAWDLFHRNAVRPEVTVAIIDGGFPYDQTTGLLRSDMRPGDRAPDLPIWAPQYDFVDEDYTSGGPNPANCGTPGSCPWHGADVLQTIVAVPGNQLGTAGVISSATPLLFRSALAFDVISAIRTAVYWGADVINMSFGMECGTFCPGGLVSAWYDIGAGLAREMGVTMVAAAGNGGSDGMGDDLDSLDSFPCEINGVICVGALDNTVTTRAGYSNFDGGVDIFGPGTVWRVDPQTVMNANPANPADPASLMLPNSMTLVSGTSFASPFVAGVAALMLGLNPYMTPGDVLATLQRTARPSPDATMRPGYVNAFEAARAASPPPGPAGAQRLSFLLERFQVGVTSDQIIRADSPYLRVSVRYEGGGEICSVRRVPSTGEMRGPSNVLFPTHMEVFQDGDSIRIPGALRQPCADIALTAPVIVTVEVWEHDIWPDADDLLGRHEMRFAPVPGLTGRREETGTLRSERRRGFTPDSPIEWLNTLTYRVVWMPGR